MPKDTKQDDYTFSDDLTSEDDMPMDGEETEEEETEEDLSDDVKEALGIDEDGPIVKPIKLNPKEKGKKPAKAATPISDWLPADDARALEHIDSLY